MSLSEYKGLHERYKAEAFKMLNEAHLYASKYSGCTKVAVGSVISHFPMPGAIISHGANISLPCSCKDAGCLRVAKYGENSKLHRNPEDCRAIHSEIDAICKAACQGYKLLTATIYVTRYPCEACARAIVDAGISRVVYGRQQECSEETMSIFKSAGVDVYHMKDWDAPDVTY